MNIEWFRKFQLNCVLSRRDIARTVILFATWYLLFQLRTVLIIPHCTDNPANNPCVAENVLPLDRVALNLTSQKADDYSFVTQYASGAAAFAVPALWNLAQISSRSLSPVGALVQIGTDFVLLLQATALNGSVGEVSRLLTQRPRPFVYENPAKHGPNPNNYVSFYSGHTSFSALAMALLVLILISRKAPFWLIGCSLAAAQALVFMTGLFRVLSGRHFVTDVVAGAIAGTVVAMIIWWIHKPADQAIKNNPP